MATQTNNDLGINGLQDRHRDALPFYRRLMIFCLLIGFLLLLIGLFLVPEYWFAFLVPGIMALCVAIFPWLALRERAERIEGLSVLNDEWRDVERSGGERPHAKEGLIALLWSIYDNNRRG